MPAPGDERLPAVLRGIAGREAARLRDGTLPWTWWLERAARFGRRYGFTDTLLISAQWRAATDVRSYGAWRSAGRQVRRGETGVRILSETTGGGLRAVFDISQTDGLPPEGGRQCVPAEARRRLAALAAGYGVADGPVPDDLRAATALAHQLAHALGPCDRPDRPDRPGRPGRACQGRRRFEADSAAYLVLAHLGLDTGLLDFPGSAAPYATPETGDRILATARRICAADAHDRDLMSAALRFFLAGTEGSWVPGYLAGRGFARSVQRHRRIGYAPPGPHTLADHLRARGHSGEAIVAAGLARRGRKGLYDTFRDRAMFAIRSAGDETIAGFIGRLPDGAKGPKYLNGPDTATFHKSELLYGLHEARERLASGAARPVVVEGPLDAIAVDLSSPGHAAVATCGLSPTAAQLAALGRIADLDRTGLVLALDGDEAGRAATARLWERLRHVAGPVDAVLLDAGRDPADVLRERGRAGLREALRALTGLMDVVVDAVIGPSTGPVRGVWGVVPPQRYGPAATNEERLAAVRAATAVIAAGRPAEAARQVVRVADLTGVPCALVTGELAEAIGTVNGR